MKPLYVLISLHRGYGLGDAVQMSTVLRHVAKHRPHWTIHFQAEAGRHCVGRGIVEDTFEFGHGPHAHYDAEYELLLFDTWHGYADRPNTRVSSCLKERFGIDWDAECGRYRVQVSEEAERDAVLLVHPGGLAPGSTGDVRRKGKVVAVHYQGDSAKDKKNLTHSQAIAVCRVIETLGCTPLLIDWRDESPIASRDVRSTGKTPLSRQWGADAEMNCAVISHCAAFVGIDSGPAKCASATDTPSLVVWTGHHPAPFHDPAPNTTHLVPCEFHNMEPVRGDQGVVNWFSRHYQVRYYTGDLVAQIGAWLLDTLGLPKPTKNYSRVERDTAE